MLHEKKIVLDPRLSLIAELAGHCECYADIGCDHGRLGAFMLQNGLCHRAQLTDISEPSLKKARALIALLELSDRVDFCVGDGAQALIAPADVVVIAGMGGATIGQIVRQGRERLNNARLILQPNVASTELREVLSDTGYCITDERVVQDGRRNYIVIQAERGVSNYSQREKIVGPVLLRRLPPELKPYAEFRLRVLQKAYGGAVKGGNQTQQVQIEIEKAVWEEVCACLQR